MVFAILISLMFFFVCVCLGILLGFSVLQGILTFIIILLPAFVIEMLAYNPKIWLYGLSVNTEGINYAAAALPFSRLLNNVNEYSQIKIFNFEILAYILCYIVIALISMYFYNKRKTEVATSAFAFPVLQYIFKYGATFCAMLLGGMFFVGSGSNIYWILIGYFIGSIIGYFASEILINKSFWVFKNIKGYTIYLIVIIVVMLGLKFDITGREAYTPAFDKIKSIYLSNGTYALSIGKDRYTDKDNLSNIYSFHKQLINDKNQYTNNTSNRNVYFIYKLKNGKELKRKYFVSEEKYKKYFINIIKTNN